MKHWKIKWGFWLLLLFGIITKRFISLVNYLFALTLHELAHIFVASKKGYSIKSVNLDMFGMSCDLKEKVEPEDSFSINIAGPVFNILLCVCCLAFYWIFPKSFIYLNDFCLANLVLAVFNLIPIYPLDGSKIFKNAFKSEKSYKIVDLILRLSLSIIFLILFICSIFNKIMYIFLMFSLFFILAVPKKELNFSLFKNKNKKFEKVEVLKVNKQVKLLELLKKINTKKFTIFYISELKIFINENEIVDLATNFSLYEPLKDVLKNINR